MKKPLTYRDAGVDIDAAAGLVDRIREFVKPTLRPEVMSDVGGFGAAVSLAEFPLENPVLVSSTDGVGTKLRIAFQTGVHDTVGIDLVAMCANDVVVQGAEPLFFLDYFATGRLEPGVAEAVIRGIAAGCQEARCSLVGGETAELPGMYPEGEYDLAGFCVGVVDRDRMIDGSSITVGDRIVGLGSTGLHSNGYSLARKILLDGGRFGLDHVFPELGKPLGEVLLTPTRIYVRTVLNLIRDFTVKGMAHITGGGIPENLPRILPHGCRAVVDRGAWEMPALFRLLQELGPVPEEEMYRTFNCGVGLVVIVPPEEEEETLARLEALGETAWVIGTIEERAEDQSPLEWAA
ncbi:phosphoribosylformylglycinamidine cyclo-ligase [Deferrisoma camini]|uniref:phosphoribosylformylglycinamidine cyclo-ligase n=1 Tax=Deferrisoma camini TaxID=1035120 RepID=UPI00046D6740|nr:phosphoribosylformylglycinamidine cyclo-ligase [Deferrisoma camini]